MFASSLGKKFWAEVVYTDAYLINKCSTSSIKSDTLDYRWYGVHGDYSNFITFGCAAYAHIKKVKLYTRALTCIMLDIIEELKTCSGVLSMQIKKL